MPSNPVMEVATVKSVAWSKIINGLKAPGILPERGRGRSLASTGGRTFAEPLCETVASSNGIFVKQY